MAKSDTGEDVQKALGKVPGIVENAFTDAMDKLGIGVDDEHKRRAPKKGAVVVVYKKKKHGRGSDSSSEKEKSKSEKDEKPPIQKSPSKGTSDHKHKKKGKKNEQEGDDSPDKRKGHHKSHKKHKSKEGRSHEEPPSRIEISKAEPMQTNTMSGLSQLAPATIRTTEDGGVTATNAPATNSGSGFRILQPEPQSSQRQKAAVSQYPKDVLVRAKQQEVNQPSTSAAGGYKIIKELKPYVPDTPSNREKVGVPPRAPTGGKLATDHEKPRKMKKTSSTTTPPAKRSSTKVSALNANDIGSREKPKKPSALSKTTTPKGLTGPKGVAAPKDPTRSNVAKEAVKKFDNRSVSFIKEKTAPEVAAMAEPKKAEVPADIEKQLAKQNDDAAAATAESAAAEKASRRRRKYYLACCLALVALFALIMITVMLVQYGASGKRDDSSTTTALTDSSTTVTGSDATISGTVSGPTTESDDDITTVKP